MQRNAHTLIPICVLRAGPKSRCVLAIADAITFLRNLRSVLLSQFGLVITRFDWARYDLPVGKRQSRRVCIVHARIRFRREGCKRRIKALSSMRMRA